jgi:hypothetical protein
MHRLPTAHVVELQTQAPLVQVPALPPLHDAASLHRHPLPEHVKPAGQARPHPPQLLALFVRFTHPDVGQHVCASLLQCAPLLQEHPPFCDDRHTSPGWQ